jgi:hypothetical protein
MTHNGIPTNSEGVLFEAGADGNRYFFTHDEVKRLTEKLGILTN